MCRSLVNSKYDKVLLLGDFNTEISEQRIKPFLYMHELSNLVNRKPASKLYKMQVA